MRTNKAPINIFMTANIFYAQHLTVALTSVLETNKNNFFEIAIAIRDLDEHTFYVISNHFNKYENCVVRIACPTENFKFYEKRAHYTIDNLMRLFIHSFFPNSNRVIYLDSDIIVLDDLWELWTIDLQGNVIGAVPIPNSTRMGWLGFTCDLPYFNSGVLVIDLILWEKLNFPDRLLGCAYKNAPYIRDADQDILNCCLINKWLHLDYKWNVISTFFKNNSIKGISAQHLQEIRNNASIIHFNGGSKPWEYMNNHARRNLYWEFIEKTPFKEYEPGDYSFKNWGIKKFGPLVPSPMKQLLKKMAKVGSDRRKTTLPPRPPEPPAPISLAEAMSGK